MHHPAARRARRRRDAAHRRRRHRRRSRRQGAGHEPLRRRRHRRAAAPRHATASRSRSPARRPSCLVQATSASSASRWITSSCAPADGVALPPRQALVVAATAAASFAVAFVVLGAPLWLAAAGSHRCCWRAGAGDGDRAGALHALSRSRAVAGVLTCGVSGAAGRRHRVASGSGRQPGGALRPGVLERGVVSVAARAAPPLESRWSMPCSMRTGSNGCARADYLFTQPMPDGVAFPYAIGLYVVSLPWMALTRDHVTLLRIVVCTAHILAGLLLYVAIVRRLQDQLAGALAVVLWSLVPTWFLVVGNANLTGAFGQSAATATLLSATIWSLGPRDLPAGGWAVRNRSPRPALARRHVPAGAGRDAGAGSGLSGAGRGRASRAGVVDRGHGDCRGDIFRSHLLRPVWRGLQIARPGERACERGGQQRGRSRRARARRPATRRPHAVNGHPHRYWRRRGPGSASAGRWCCWPLLARATASHSIAQPPDAGGAGMGRRERGVSCRAPCSCQSRTVSTGTTSSSSLACSTLAYPAVVILAAAGASWCWRAGPIGPGGVGRPRERRRVGGRAQLVELDRLIV